MQNQFKFATFNKRLLRAQHQRLVSIRNLNHRHEIKYHKQFNNNSNRLENGIDKLKNSVLVVQFQLTNVTFIVALIMFR